MLKRINVLRTAGMPGAALLVVLQTGCAGIAPKAKPAAELIPAAEPTEIPITTASEEALAVFLEGRELSDNLREDEAREHFDKAIELDPDFAQAYLYRSFAFTSNEDLKSYLKQAVALADKVSEGEQLLIEQSKANNLDNNLGKQLELCKQLAQKYPRDKRARSLLGIVYYGRDEDEKAIAELEAAVALDKDYPPPYNQLGYAHWEIGEYEKAEQAFKDYIRLIPDEPNPYDSMADLCMKIGRFEEAIENYQKAVERDPVFGISQQKIGTSLVFLGKCEEGREACKKAIEMEMTPWDQLGDRDMIVRSYLYEGDYPKAIEATEKLLEAATEAGLPAWISYSHLMKCRILKEAGDLDAAEQSLAECRQSVQAADFTLAAQDFFARDGLVNEARIMAKRQDFETALAKAEEYKAKLEAREDPNTLENYHGLVGMIYFDKGDYEKAIEHLRQSNQENPYTLYYHAVAESKAGNKDEAAKLFKRAAHWNEDSYDYAFIRAKALAAIGK